MATDYANMPTMGVVEEPDLVRLGELLSAIYTRLDVMGYTMIRTEQTVGGISPQVNPLDDIPTLQEGGLIYSAQLILGQVNDLSARLAEIEVALAFPAI